MRTDAVKQRILDLIANITPLDSVAMEQARARQQVLTKPADGLGRKPKTWPCRLQALQVRQCQRWNAKP